MNNERRLLWWLTLFAAAIRVLFFLISVNATGDAPPRAMVAAGWAGDPVWVTPGHWLPVPIYLAGLSLWVWDNVWTSPRLLPLVFGVAAVWPLYQLVRLYFSVGVAAASCLLFALFGLHIAQSVVSSAEALWMFLSLWAVFHFARWWTEQRLVSLIWAGLLWLPLTWSKPEAWWVTALSGVFVLFRQFTAKGKSWRPIFLYGVIIALGPVLWLLVCHLTAGDMLLTFHRTGAGAAYHARSALYKLAFWPILFVLALGPLTILPILVGLGRGIRERRGLLLLAFALAYLLPFWAMQLMGSGGANARHVIFPATLLLPFAALAIERWAQGSPAKTARVALIVGGSWLLLIFALGETRRGEFSQKFASISPRAKERPHVMEVTAWLRQHVRPTDRVVVDHFNDEESSLQYHIRLPVEQVKIFWGDPQNPREFEEAFTPRPRFIVAAENGAIARVAEQLKLGSQWSRRYTNTVYTVFEAE